MLASSRYRAKLVEAKESSTSTEKNRKRKLKLDELDDVKRSKVSIQETIGKLRLEVEKETLKAEKSEKYAKNNKRKTRNIIYVGEVRGSTRRRV